jgi:gamma-glutamylputrescine oxidase
VLAGSAHLGALAPGLADTVLPVTGYVAVTAPLGARLGEAIAFRGAVSDSRSANHHYRIVDGDRLMWAGGAGLWPGNPLAVAKRFKAAIARTYPQLGEVEFEHAWSGTMGFSVHRVPQVGEVIPGLWLASAFGAHGINTSAMVGELIAGAITENDDRWRLFLPYELVWAGGRLGRVVQHVGTWSRGLHEDWVASVARRREAVRRGEAEQTGGVVAEPIRMAEPPPVAGGMGPIEPPAVPQVAEVESLLRRVASHERARGGIPSLARTGEAPRRETGDADPRPA